MDIVWILLVGAVAGILAKMVMPGDKMEPGGCILTMLLGMAGAILMGKVVVPMLRITPNETLISKIIGATIGAIILIALFRLVQGRAPKA
ncbi:MAG: GlsB/YeaQ/YmgE family stress response membrane protein [Fimbriimonadales bacterium]